MTTKTKRKPTATKRTDDMETGVHYVVNYHTNRYNKLAIVKKGRTKVKVCMIESPIRVQAIPIDETRWMDRLYDCDAAASASKFLYYGKYRGITKAAEKFLNEIAKEVNNGKSN